MKQAGLPVRWIRWRRRRYNALSAQGLASHLAYQLADGEAHGRRRIAGVVGHQAARDAQLQLIEDGDTFRFVLTGDLSDLTPKQLAAIKELNSRSSGAA